MPDLTGILECDKESSERPERRHFNEMRRHSVSFLEAVGAEKIPAPSTAGDFVRRFQAPDVVDLMEAANESRRKVWAQQPASFFQRAEIDVDGTIAPTSGECKEGMEISYDGQWGYAPLIVTLAQTGEVLYAVNRSGTAPLMRELPNGWIGVSSWSERPVFARCACAGIQETDLGAGTDRGDGLPSEQSGAELSTGGLAQDDPGRERPEAAFAAEALSLLCHEYPSDPVGNGGSGSGKQPAL